MDTLIELYDERAIENVAGAETFRPRRVVYLCPQEVAEDRQLQEKLREFFASRGHNMKIEFVGSSLYKADRIFHQLKGIVEGAGDCAVDVTGGTDAALVAAGMLCQAAGVPTFTYSRKQNRFYDISNAPFADRLPCTLSYTVEEFFRMAGGTLRMGRVDNQVLKKYMKDFDGFFAVFLRHRREWGNGVLYIQRISRPVGEEISLHAEGSFQQKGERGSRVYANPGLLRDLEQLGFLKNLNIREEEWVSFDFSSEPVRAWLRDVGSVLELYLYKVCVDSGLFRDVISSAVVDWDEATGHDTVRNEIDVVASAGMIPVFISCKATEVKTEALNELAILRDRFGGKGAKAVIATTEPCGAAARHRAAQLGIAVVDLEELSQGKAEARLRVIMKADKTL